MSVLPMVLPGVAAAGDVEGAGGHDPPELSLAERVVQHQPGARELEPRVHLPQDREWSVGVGGHQPRFLS